MSIRRSHLATVAASFMLVACADSPDSVQTQYVSDAQYRTYGCDDVEEELARVSGRVSELTKKQEDASTADAVSMGVGLVVFWPALFFLAATDDHSGELGRLKGEYEALQRVARKKDCAIQMPQPLPAKEEVKAEPVVYHGDAR